MNADDILYEPIAQSQEDQELDAEQQRAYYRKLGEIIRKHTYKEFYKQYEVCEDSGS